MRVAPGTTAARSVEWQLKSRRVGLIVAAWVVVGVMIAVYDHFALHSTVAAGPASWYTFLRSLLLHASSGLVGALLGGPFLVFYANDRLRDKPYWISVAAVVAAFVVIVAMITLAMGLIVAPIQSGLPWSNPATTGQYLAFVTDPFHAKNMLVWSAVVAVTQLALQVSNKFGPGVFWQMARGWYHTPREERRIVMFADLTGATALAERLGDEQYHSLLKDFFADLTDPIIYNRGEIYQYVGDQVVISWPLAAGLGEGRCLRCFFDMQAAIAARAAHYRARYATVPDFKAGMHYGRVIAGEIGIVKRDVTFSGDVLNTAARIQGKCHELGARLLVSDALLELLPASPDQRRVGKGQIELRGRSGSVAVSAVESHQSHSAEGAIA